MYVHHYVLSNTKNQDDAGLTIPLDTNRYWKNNQMLSEKAPAEELDENNQKNSRMFLKIPILC